MSFELSSFLSIVHTIQCGHFYINILNVPAWKYLQGFVWSYYVQSIIRRKYQYSSVFPLNLIPSVVYFLVKCLPWVSKCIHSLINFTWLLCIVYLHLLHQCLSDISKATLMHCPVFFCKALSHIFLPIILLANFFCTNYSC